MEANASISVGYSGNAQFWGDTTLQTNANITVGDTAKLYFWMFPVIPYPPRPVTFVAPSVGIHLENSASFYNYGNFEPKVGFTLHIGESSKVWISPVGNFYPDEYSVIRTKPLSSLSVNGTLEIGKNTTMIVGEASTIIVGNYTSLLVNGPLTTEDHSIINLSAHSSLNILSANISFTLSRLSSVSVEEGMRCMVSSPVLVAPLTRLVLGSNQDLPDGVTCFKVPIQ